MRRIRPLRQRRQSRISIIDAIADPNLFAPWFKNDKTWQAWFAFLAALFALPMTREQLTLYRQCTGRDDPPTQPSSEAWLVCGRRAGKSFILALCAVFLACFHDYRQYLAPGERGTVLVIAADRKQARVILRYVRALLRNVPMLARLIEREAVESFDLTNRITLEVATASYRSVRGYAIVAALCDELAFWRDETSTSPDVEVLAAIRPGMASIPNAMLLCASSPYARRGALWTAHRKHFGKEGDPVLVWQAPTRTMNETVPQSVIDDAMAADPASAAAEYFARFRTDVESFIAREAVENCIALGERERPFIAGIKYVGFCDPSGGSSDSMTVAVGHNEKGMAVLDAIREVRPPFSPEDVVVEFCALLKSYGIRKVTGDRYAGEWPRERFRVNGITYEPAAKPKSDLYRDMLPMINSGKVDLLDHDRLLNQLVSLERRTARGGKDSIDHAPGGHDDVANCVAGVVTSFGVRKGSYDESLKWVTDGADDDTAWQTARRNQFVISGGVIR